MDTLIQRFDHCNLGNLANSECAQPAFYFAIKAKLQIHGIHRDQILYIRHCITDTV